MAGYHATPTESNASRNQCVTAGQVTDRKDDAPDAGQAALVNVAGVGSTSVDGGLIQTTAG